MKIVDGVRYVDGVRVVMTMMNSVLIIEHPSLLMIFAALMEIRSESAWLDPAAGPTVRRSF